MQHFLKALQESGLHFSVSPERYELENKNTEMVLSQLTQQIHGMLRNVLPLDAPIPITPQTEIPEAEDFPLTDIQYAYLIGRNPGLELGGLTSCLYTEWDINALNLKVLNDALNKLIEYHPMLRASLSLDGQQRILSAPLNYTISIQDGRTWSTSEKEIKLATLRQEMETQLLPVDKTPTFDIRATIINDDITRLHIYFDLMFVDLHSVHLILRDWWLIYQGHELPMLPANIGLHTHGFRTYIKSERYLQGQPQGLRDKAYWEQQLDTLPQSPELPLKNVPELISPPVSKRYSRKIAAETLLALRQKAESRKLTLETVLLGMYAEVLRQWSKRQNFTLTITQFGRRPYFDGIENVVGNFLHPMLLGIRGTGNESLNDRLTQIQTDLMMNRWHCSYNGVQVLRELTRRGHGNLSNGNRAAAAPVVFSNTLTANLDDVVTDIGWTEATQIYSSNQTPQVWLENQIVRVDDLVQINWNTVSELFPDGMVEAMLDAYLALITTCAENDFVWDKNASLVKLPASDLMERAAANATDTEFDLKLLHEMVLQAAEKFPNTIALVQGEKQITYAEMVSRACAIAQQLRTSVLIHPNDIVAVSLPQSPELVIGLLGILMSGAAYVAIDPLLPVERRMSLLNRCSAKGIVTASTVFKHDELANFFRINLDECPKHIDSLHWASMMSVQGLDDLAYIIFTSGSTGEPKGVMASHRNAANTVLDINHKFHVTEKDTVLSVAPAGFDLSVYDYFGLLGVGGKIVFSMPETANDPKVWLELLIKHQITIWDSVPAPVKVLVDRNGSALSETKLRLILMSGDWIPVDLPERIRENLPHVAIISLGGATEGSIWSIHYPIQEIDKNWKSIPYGKPLANQTFHVLNNWLLPCPKWVTGELYIGGDGVTQGYLGDAEKTALRFMTHPITGERLYRTGDLGRYIAGGLIEILGREDNQVKINGYRIELGEIEACLLNHDNASHVVIDAPIHAKTGQRHIVSYIVPGTAETLDDPLHFQEQLRETARKTLPSYMVPSYYVLLPHMPLTSNGKIDRKALPLPWPDTEEHTDAVVAPANDIEAKILQLWQVQLQHDDFDVTDGFFDIGGDSLHAVGLLSALRQEFKITPIGEQDIIEGLFMNSNIQSFSRIIETLLQSQAVNNL
ncbi:non-ribosomal peptide synthetase [Xenorhabdus hominickii]|uniref:Non-ribosomal peptide synthetase n=1 Tax=Xenorhabdus hominickii TaxID=351679 RepID=A0A2G0Q8H7_XENHO|nr:non-ribosomal peptide synthetase [Xenorhabdus hominickii]AOM41233.1 non-ribosomal peptide synthetase [Xenorhabdus hominickii]PHM55515.1 pyochelin synthetase F [Xenorhabdus hominickii]PHM57120.1 pyochelin synthetase F [Xenorhabdus hominickii]